MQSNLHFSSFAYSWFLHSLFQLQADVLVMSFLGPRKDVDVIHVNYYILIQDILEDIIQKGGQCMCEPK